MKKIRMITFHTPKNYGAILQAYALMNCLKGFSDDVSIIDYNTEHLRSVYPILPKVINLKSCIKHFLLLPHYREIKRKYAKFEEFVSKRLSLTKRYESVEELKEEKWDSDSIFFTGSDQVFNPNRIIDERKAFYLDFVPEHCKRIAYAASFGSEFIPNDKFNEIKNFLNRFDSISVREFSGKRFLDNLLGKNVPVVLDPVFLSGKSEWEQIANGYKTKFCNYLLYYRILGSKDSDTYAKKIAKEKKLNLVVITNGLNRFPFDNVLYDVGPAEFIDLIRNAKFVVTDAFHGVAFSVIFQKQFVFSDTHTTTNNRGMELLAELDIQSLCYCKSFRINSCIDYEHVCKKLSKKINSSLMYIESVLQSNKQ